MGINKAYMRTDLLHDVRKAFTISNPQSIQLHAFLADDALKKVKTAVNKLSFTRNYVPDLHCYDEAKRIPKELRSVFAEITALVQFIAKKKLKCKELTIRKFGKKQYTVLHDAYKEKPGVDVMLDLTPAWHPAAGGAMVYTRKGSGVLTIAPAYNTFSIVQRTKSMMRFVKYVNHHAENKRVLILGTFR